MERITAGLWLIGVVGLWGCTQSAKPDKPAPAEDARVAASPAPTPSPVPADPPLAWADAAQIVLVVTDDWSDATAELSTFERDGSGWTRVATWEGVIGHTGLAWGKGMHGDSVPRGREGPIKIEGDGKSPAGVFSIGKAYGYAESAPEGASVPYTQVDGEWRCVDDPGSSHYTKILDESTVTKDWSSAEDMKRRDDLYRWVVEIEHNLAATPRGGSCIFFHVWRDRKDGTVGCAAMAREHIESLIAWLDPAQRPIAVLLPRAELDALKSDWQLP